LKRLLLAAIIMVSTSASSRVEFTGSGKTIIEFREHYGKHGNNVAKWDARLVGNSRIQKVQLSQKEVINYRFMSPSELLRTLREPAGSRLDR